MYRDSRPTACVIPVICAALWALAWGSCLSSACRAGDDLPGVTVTGEGEIHARPDQVRVQLRVAGSGELTGDAIVKYQSALRQTEQALEKLGLEQLQVKLQGTSLAQTGGQSLQQMMMGGAANPAGKTELEFSQGVVVVLSKIRDRPEQEVVELLAKVLDAARDSGAELSGGSDNSMAQMFGVESAPVSQAATFELSDLKQLQSQASQRASEQAKAQAERLAELAGCRVGRVLSMEVLPSRSVAGKQSQQQQWLSAIYGIESETSAQEPGQSNSYAEIPVRVSLRVRFALDERTTD